MKAVESIFQSCVHLKKIKSSNKEKMKSILKYLLEEVFPRGERHVVRVFFWVLV